MQFLDRASEFFTIRYHACYSNTYQLQYLIDKWCYSMIADGKTLYAAPKIAFRIRF